MRLHIVDTREGLRSNDFKFIIAIQSWTLLGHLTDQSTSALDFGFVRGRKALGHQDCPAIATNTDM
jgi:hypothetical protein